MFPVGIVKTSQITLIIVQKSRSYTTYTNIYTTANRKYIVLHRDKVVDLMSKWKDKEIYSIVERYANPSNEIPTMKTLDK